MTRVTNHHTLYRLRAERVAYLLAGLPFLRMVGLNGSLARGEATVQSDIDFLIITAPRRMYTVRFFATLLTQLLGVRRSGSKIAGRICLNRYQTTNQLDVVPHNHYHAEVFHRVIPLINIDQTYHHYLEANQWMADFGCQPIEETHRRSRSYPFSHQVRRLGEWLLGGRFGTWLEKRLKNYQLAKIARNPLTARYPDRVVITNDMLLFHVPAAGEVDDDLARWDAAAAAYDALHGRLGDAFRRRVLDPVLFPLLGEVHGQIILDAGCGNGYQTNWLQTRGASVTGLDGSSVMVARAQQNFPTCQFTLADLRNHLPFADDFFDQIVATLVLHVLADPKPTLWEFHRILKPNGSLVLVIPHPAFAYPTTQVTKTPLDYLLGRPGHLIVQTYTTTQKVTVPVAGLHLPTTRYQRSLATYWHWFAETGWQVVDLEEPVDPVYRPLTDIPLVLIWKLIPIPPPPEKSEKS
ncbi:methyltransferase domain-containing protein [Candidatus Berkelbacteria bacterium]|nr:methyltransferase domain-containing protein [Candidatus Berkelbacteria bacterium]